MRSKANNVSLLDAADKIEKKNDYNSLVKPENKSNYFNLIFSS